MAKRIIRFSGLRRGTALGLMIGALLGAGVCRAQEPSSEDLSKQLANPIAALISVPLQPNYER